MSRFYFYDITIIILDVEQLNWIYSFFSEAYHFPEAPLDEDPRESYRGSDFSNERHFRRFHGHNAPSGELDKIN